MSTQTTNLQLIKPSRDDYYDIEVQNENMDKIDTELKKHLDHLSNKSNPHSVTKSQIGLSNVPNVSTNDQTPTYTEATAVTALASGEKLSTAFSKISKAVSSLITHLADGASHITNAERTAWNAKPTQATIDNIVNGTTAVKNATNAVNSVNATNSTKLDGSYKIDFMQAHTHLGTDNGGVNGSGIDLNTIYAVGLHEFSGNFSAVVNAPVGWYGDIHMLVIGRGYGYNTTQLVQIGDKLCYRQSGWNKEWGKWYYSHSSTPVRVQETAPTDTTSLWIW